MPGASPAGFDEPIGRPSCEGMPHGMTAALRVAPCPRALRAEIFESRLRRRAPGSLRRLPDGPASRPARVARIIVAGNAGGAARLPGARATAQR